MERSEQKDATSIVKLFDLPKSAKIPMIRAYYMAITLLKTWWWSFPRRRLRLAAHPCPDLLFKGYWSGSQHVLSSRERDLTGKGEKTEKNIHTCQGHCMTSCSPGCGLQRRKNPQGIKWRGKKSFLKCIAITARMALLRVLVPHCHPLRLNHAPR